MKIKTVSGQLREIEEAYTQTQLWVSWSDIKPILDEYQQTIENSQLGLADYGLIGDAMLEDID